MESSSGGGVLLSGCQAASLTVIQSALRWAHGALLGRGGAENILQLQRNAGSGTVRRHAVCSRLRGIAQRGQHILRVLRTYSLYYIETGSARQGRRRR